MDAGESNGTRTPVPASGMIPTMHAGMRAFSTTMYNASQESYADNADAMYQIPYYITALGAVVG
jgi:hypothetical protein